MGRFAAIFLGLALGFGSAGTAHAKQTQTYEYRFAQVWSAAFRLVRVDLECRVTDRDDEIGFVMFEYSDGERSYPGSLQLVPVKELGKEVIRVELQIPEQPTYVEIMILDKLRKKLSDEYGEPVTQPTPPPNGGKQEPSAPKKDRQDGGQGPGSQPPGQGGQRGPSKGNQEQGR